MSRAARFYRVLLRAYPPHWRSRFAAEMCAAFEYEHARLQTASIWRRVAFWIATAVQAVWFGVVERVLGGGSLRSFVAVDWRAAYRALLASPLVTAAALLSLALGIGANTALFSIVNSLVLKRLPVPDPERLVRLDPDSITNPIWEQIRERKDQLAAGLLAYSTETFHVSAGGPAEAITGAWVSGTLFETLRLETSLGRPLTQEDDVRPAPRTGHVTVITHAFWQRRFGRAPDVIGRNLTINRQPFTIVGVTAREFTGLDVGVGWDVLVPISAEPVIRGKETRLDRRTSWWLHVMGRLPPGQSIEDATAVLRAIQPHIRHATIPTTWNESMQKSYFTDPIGWDPAATGRSPLRGRYERPLTAVLVVVGAVLLIACANIANLLLARASGRRHEFAVRLALGASRARLARQLLAESILLAIGGAAIGLLIASWGSSLLVSQLSTYSDPVFLNLSLDSRVLMFTMAVAIGTALLFGTAPALTGGRTAPTVALKEQTRSLAGERRFGTRQVLVTLQVALSLALVVAAGLFVRTFQSLSNLPLGFDPRPLMVAEIEVPPTDVDRASRWTLFQRFRDAAAQVPGVAGVVISNLTPLSDHGWNAPVLVPGGIELPPRQRINWLNPVSPGWFESYGMRLLAGRHFTEGDRIGQPPVMIVNEAFVQRRIGSGQPVLGRQVVGEIEGPAHKESYEIVGIVNDAVYRSPRLGKPPTMYVPMAQLKNLEPEFSLTVRTDAAVSAPLARRVAEALQRVDSGATIATRPFDDQIRATMTQERMIAMLSGFFGALALLMAGVGLYGVTASWVNRRRAEIGIRIALGARPEGVVGLVLRQFAWLLAIGVAAGTALSLWASKFVGSLLFNLGPRDPATFIGAALTLCAVGLLAGWLPARHAARLDPVKVLRE